MSDTFRKIEEVIKPYAKGMPVQDFVEAVSNIYHGFEASVYDASQQSLQDSAWSWLKALESLELNKTKGIRLLDFGAGTGFATLQVLQSPLGKHVREVVCYDLSPAMIEICRGKMNVFPNVAFTFLSDASGREQLAQEKPFDLVVTNALLHHILDVESFLKFIAGYVAPSGYYIAGHEPNYNFYINRALTDVTRKFQRYKRIRQRLTLKYWMHKLKVRSYFHDIVAQTNQELIKRELITQPIPREYLHKLVDIHVPFGISTVQPWGEVGFSQAKVSGWLGNNFEATGIYTYSHIKDSLANQDIFWKPQLKKLAAAYPQDGADVLMIFRRKH